jgi:hypothetical protein
MVRPYPSDSDIEALVRAFFDTSLPRDQWTHPAHLAVGLHLVRTLPFDDALAAMRDGIHAWLARHGSTGAGYSATITRFYLHLIAAWDREHPASGSVAEDVAALVEELGHRNVPARWYSPGRLASAAAAAGWVEPDLQPLPALGALPAGVA